jgi:1,4-alpha-glucan branching enzyme
MIQKTHSPLTNHTRILFELPASLWADRIFVVGDFGEGSPRRTPLTQEQDGVWRAPLDLRKGQQYQFHYLIDGERRPGAQADGYGSTADGCHTNLINLN